MSERQQRTVLAPWCSSDTMLNVSMACGSAQPWSFSLLHSAQECVHKRRSRPGFTGRKRQGRTASVRWLRAIAWISQTRCEDFVATITCGYFPRSVSVSCLQPMSCAGGCQGPPPLHFNVLRRAVMGLGNKKNNFIFFLTLNSPGKVKVWFERFLSLFSWLLCSAPLPTRPD